MSRWQRAAAGATKLQRQRIWQVLPGAARSCRKVAVSAPDVGTIAKAVLCLYTARQSMPTWEMG